VKTLLVTIVSDLVQILIHVRRVSHNPSKGHGPLKSSRFNLLCLIRYIHNHALAQANALKSNLSSLNHREYKNRTKMNFLWI